MVIKLESGQADTDPYRVTIFCNWPNSGGMLPEKLLNDTSLQN